MSSSHSEYKTSSAATASSVMTEELKSLKCSYQDYVQYVKKKEGEAALYDSSAVLEVIAAGDYSKLEALLLIHLDDLDGIKSSIDVSSDSRKYPTGIAFVRDARSAIKKLAPNDPLIVADNMLLRALATVPVLDIANPLLSMVRLTFWISILFCFLPIKI